MADISKCEGVGCNKKETCYRFLLPANQYRQSYIQPEAQNGGCDYYWPTEDCICGEINARNCPVHQMRENE